jgi:NifB/MoaA-like Fe-S oxidoreductase
MDGFLLANRCIFCFVDQLPKGLRRRSISWTTSTAFPF